MAMHHSSRTLPQQRAQGLLYDDLSNLLGSQNLNDFASGTQPSDDVRHNLVLLSLPVDHIWTDVGLHNEPGQVYDPLSQCYLPHPLRLFNVCTRSWRRIETLEFMDLTYSSAFFSLVAFTRD